MLDHQQQIMGRSKKDKSTLNKQAQQKILPPIPDKIYFTIGEAADLCFVKPHVLRYWEQEFPQLKPNKRRGNRRYYQRTEILLIRKIKSLLYDQGFTIEGARTKLSNVSEPLEQAGKNFDSGVLKNVMSDLKEILVLLEQ